MQDIPDHRISPGPGPGARPCPSPGGTGRRRHARLDQHFRPGLPAHPSRPPGLAAGQGPRREDRRSRSRQTLPDGHGRERLLVGDDRAGGGRFPLLLDLHRWRGVVRPGQRDIFWHGPPGQRHRDPVPGRGLLRRQGRAARRGARTLVFLADDAGVAAHLRLYPARLRRRPAGPLPGALPPARRRRRRAGVGGARARQPHPGQPDRRAEGEADAGGDGEGRRPQGRRAGGAAAAAVGRGRAAAGFQPDVRGLGGSVRQRPDPDDRPHLPDAARPGAPGHGRAFDGRDADLPHRPGPPRPVRLPRRFQRRGGRLRRRWLRPQDRPRRGDGRCEGVQRQGPRALPEHRHRRGRALLQQREGLPGRPRAGRDQDQVLRIARHGARVADVAAEPARVRPDALSQRPCRGGRGAGRRPEPGGGSGGGSGAAREGRFIHAVHRLEGPGLGRRGRIHRWRGGGPGPGAGHRGHEGRGVVPLRALRHGLLLLQAAQRQVSGPAVLRGNLRRHQRPRRAPLLLQCAGPGVQGLRRLGQSRRAEPGLRRKRSRRGDQRRVPDHLHPQRRESADQRHRDRPTRGHGHARRRPAASGAGDPGRGRQGHGQGKSYALRPDDRGDQLRLRGRHLRRAGPQPDLQGRRAESGLLDGGGRHHPGPGQDQPSQPGAGCEPEGGRGQGVGSLAGRHRQRRLLGDPGPPEHDLPRIVPRPRRELRRPAAGHVGEW